VNWAFQEQMVLEEKKALLVQLDIMALLVCLEIKVLIFVFLELCKPNLYLSKKFLKGYAGRVGYKGDRGFDGLNGLPGRSGPIGDQGMNGFKGAKGDAGDNGLDASTIGMIFLKNQTVKKFHKYFYINRYKYIS
jgi:hypothetical protein